MEEFTLAQEPTEPILAGTTEKSSIATTNAVSQSIFSAIQRTTPIGEPARLVSECSVPVDVEPSFVFLVKLLPVGII